MATLKRRLYRKNSSGTYDTVHLETDASIITGTLPISHGGTGNTTGLAASATKLANARTIRTNLGSTSAASFNGTANITPGVTGTLPVTKGGTGVTSLDALKDALGITNNTGIDTVDVTLTNNGTYDPDRKFNLLDYINHQFIRILVYDTVNPNNNIFGFILSHLIPINKCYIKINSSISNIGGSGTGSYTSGIRGKYIFGADDEDMGVSIVNTGIVLVFSYTRNSTGSYITDVYIQNNSSGSTQKQISIFFIK